jgi:hypothetical protein
MKAFNLSEWVLKHRSFTGFMLALVVLGGLFAYFKLGQRKIRRSPSESWWSKPSTPAPPRWK